MSGTNPVGTWALPLSTGPSVQDPTTYKGNIDSDIAVAQRVADAFAPRPASPASMTVVVDAGFIASENPAGLQSTVEVAQQSVTLAAAPGSPNSRIDLIVIDAATGVASVTAGAPGTLPSPPAMTAGKRQVAQVLVPSGAAAIIASNITDIRAVWSNASSGRGIPWAIAAGSADAITASYTPTTPNPVPDGYILGFRASAANTTATPTFNPDAINNDTVTMQGGVALNPGSIPNAGAEMLVRRRAATSNWELLNPTVSAFTTGDAKITLKTVADSGWVMANDGTLGDASSGGTTRANADAQALFTLLWTNFSNTNCPVSSGRGASAAADFAAHKTIRLPQLVGRALALAGAGAGLTARNLGDAIGAETVTLTAAQQASMPVTGTINDSSGRYAVLDGTGCPPPTGGIFSAGVCGATHIATPGAAVLTLSGATASGGGGSHNNMQPTSFVNFMIKL